MFLLLFAGSLLRIIKNKYFHWDTIMQLFKALGLKKLTGLVSQSFPSNVMCWVLSLGCQKDTEVLHVSLRLGHLLRLGCCCHHEKMLPKWSTEIIVIFSYLLKCFFLFLVGYQSWLPLLWLCFSVVFNVLKYFKINL